MIVNGAIGRLLRASCLVHLLLVVLVKTDKGTLVKFNTSRSMVVLNAPEILSSTTAIAKRWPISPLVVLAAQKVTGVPGLSALFLAAMVVQRRGPDL